MRRVLLAAAATLALIVPATAAAKETVKLDVCGPASCGTTSDRALLANLADGTNGSKVRTPGMRPYYKLVYTLDAPDSTESFSLYYLPDLGLVAGADELGRARWSPATKEFRELVARLSTGVQPFSKPVIAKVTVGNRIAAAPGTYEQLLTLRGRSAQRVARDWRYIHITTDRPSPWSDYSILKFSAKRGYLYRDGHALVLPKRMAAKIKSGRSLGATGAGLAASLALGGLGLLFLRRRAGR